MFKETAIITLVSAALVTAAVAAGPVVRENRPIANISEVALSGNGELFITQGDKEELVVEVEQSLLPRIITEVSGGRLTLRQKNGVFINEEAPKVKFYLTVKHLDHIALAGSGVVRAPGFNADKLEIASRGSGDVRIDSLEAKELAISISGSSEVKLGGQAARQTIKIAGSGKYAAADLKSAMAAVSISGSGDVLLWATDSLSIAITGSGDVKYYGQPKVSKSVTGSGGIRGLGSK